MKKKETILDSIGALIPGYGGYVERDARRNIDKQLRTQMANVLALTEKKTGELQKTFILNHELQRALEWEQVRKAINTLVSRIKHATYGESSFFSEEQLKEKELGKIYELDRSLAERIDLIKKLIEDRINEPMSPVAIVQSIAAIDDLLLERTNFINQYK